MDWLKRNKAGVGMVFFAAAGYVYTFHCPGLDPKTCETLTIALTNLGSFLTGAGILDSDYRAKFTQGLIKNDDGN